MKMLKSKARQKSHNNNDSSDLKLSVILSNISRRKDRLHKYVITCRWTNSLLDRNDFIPIHVSLEKTDFGTTVIKSIFKR